MATQPSAFSCRLADSHKILYSHSFHSNSSPTYGRNKYVFVPANYTDYRRHNSKRTFQVTAQQPSFLKNFNLGLNKKSDEEEVSDGKRSIILRNQSNPLWFGKSRQQDTGTVFVAGATGQFGARISQMLLRDGYTVRAGVTDLTFAQQLAEVATKYKIIATDDAKRLNAVEFDFKDVESTAKAIGNAGKAVVSIGPTEDGPSSDVTINDAFCVIEAAKLANVKHMVVVYESKEASANIIDGISSFFSNIFGKSGISLAELIDKIVELDLSYTILKTKSIDDFASKNDSNIILKAEGMAEENDKVSKIQVASVVAEVFANTSVSENKIIEVAARPSAPLRPIGELLSSIPRDGRKEAFAEAQAKAKAEEEARIAAENERKAKELATQLEAEAERLAEQEAKATQLAAQVKSQAGTTSIDYFVNKAKDFGIDLFGAKTGNRVITSSTSQSQNNLESLVTAVKGRVATVRGGINSSKSQSQKNVESRAATVKEVKKTADLQQNKDAPGVSQPTQVNKIFGGLFKQETIYVDDD